MRNRTLLLSGLAALLLGLTGLVLSWNMVSARTAATLGKAKFSAQPTFADASHQSTDQSDDSPFMGLSDPAAPYDQRFIDEMIMHHQGALMSSRMMIGDSERPELRDLARRIEESQQRQIDQMEAWRKQWYPNAPERTKDMDTMMSMMGSEGMMGGGEMMGNGGMMRGMMGADTSDRMFLRMMIPHHQLAIDMSEDALKNSEHKELKVLAQEIIDGQSAEITEMEGYLYEWYGEESTRSADKDMQDMMQQMMGR